MTGWVTGKGCCAESPGDESGAGVRERGSVNVFQIKTTRFWGVSRGILMDLEESARTKRLRVAATGNERTKIKDAEAQQAQVVPPPSWHL